MNRAQMTTSQTPRRPAAAAKSKSAASAAGQKQSAGKKQSGRKGAEALLARVEAVRLAQRQDGHFDCFAKATDGYCDQGGCAYHSDCLSIAKRLK